MTELLVCVILLVVLVCVAVRLCNLEQVELKIFKFSLSVKGRESPPRTAPPKRGKRPT
jgi:hypothetical protein